MFESAFQSKAVPSPFSLGGAAPTFSIFSEKLSDFDSTSTDAQGSQSFFDLESPFSFGENTAQSWSRQASNAPNAVGWTQTGPRIFADPSLGSAFNSTSSNYSQTILQTSQALPQYNSAGWLEQSFARGTQGMMSAEGNYGVFNRSPRRADGSYRHGRDELSSRLGRQVSGREYYRATGRIDARPTNSIYAYTD